MSTISDLLSRTVSATPDPDAAEDFGSLVTTHEALIEFIGLPEGEALEVFVVEVPADGLGTVHEEARETAAAVLDALDIEDGREYPDYLPTALDPGSYGGDAGVIESVASHVLHPEDGAVWTDTYSTSLVAALGVHALQFATPTSVWRAPATAGEVNRAAQEVAELGGDWLFGASDSSGSGRRRLLEQVGYGDPVFATVDGRRIVLVPDYGALAVRHLEARRPKPGGAPCKG